MQASKHLVLLVFRAPANVSMRIKPQNLSDMQLDLWVQVTSSIKKIDPFKWLDRGLYRCTQKGKGLKGMQVM